MKNRFLGDLDNWGETISDVYKDNASGYSIKLKPQNDDEIIFGGFLSTSKEVISKEELSIELDPDNFRKTLDKICRINIRMYYGNDIEDADIIIDVKMKNIKTDGIKIDRNYAKSLGVEENDIDEFLENNIGFRFGIKNNKLIFKSNDNIIVETQQPVIDYLIEKVNKS